MKHRGPGRPLDPALLAVAEELRVQDFAALHGLSTSTVRGFLADGLPHYRYPGRITIPRVEGARWLERFRTGGSKVVALVDQVVTDLRPLAPASRRLRAVRR